MNRRSEAEYLIEPKRFHSKRGRPKDPSVGEVVLIRDDNWKRVGWQKRVVEELFPGKNGRIRVVAL